MLDRLDLNSLIGFAVLLAGLAFSAWTGVSADTTNIVIGIGGGMMIPSGRPAFAKSPTP